MSDRTFLQHKKMLQETMLAKIEDVLLQGRSTDPPAYTLILGAGASVGVVPTAKEMLGFPGAGTKQIHEKSIPVWIAAERELALTPEARANCCKEFWSKFRRDNVGNSRCAAIQFSEEGLPSPGSIAAAYQSVFETACVGGLDTPERHTKYLRAVTMDGGASTRLNATHFYLASLLSLQGHSGKLGSAREPLYRGRREFARTIFTTNFDPLLQTSLQLFQLLYYMTDRPEFLSADALHTDHNPSIHLFYAHGSVHRPFLANTDEQIALLRRQNANALSGYLSNHGVIVLGYSGWDDCLLRALGETKTFSNNLYWLARSADSIADPVVEFLKGHPNAYWVEIEDGGSVMAALHSRICPGAPNTELLYNPIRSILSQLRSVNLTGIESRGTKWGEDPPEANLVAMDPEDARPAGSTSGAPLEVETIRLQVIGRLEDAQKLFTAPSDARGSWEELERQASLSYANEDWDLALAGYERLLKSTPAIPVENRALATFRLGYCRSQKREVDKAIADYTTVIVMPSAPAEMVAKARRNRAGCWTRKGDLDKAIADFTAIIETPGVPADLVAPAWAGRGNCWTQKGDFDKAIADYSAVIEMPGAPADMVARAWGSCGRAWGEKGDFDKAIADFTVAIGMPGASGGTVVSAQINRGIAWGKKGDLDKQIADYTVAIDMPGAAVNLVALARCYRGSSWLRKGDLDKATADFTAVIETPGVTADVVTRARSCLENN